MAEIGRSSFLPKETAGFTPGKIRRKRTFHIFGFIATTLLLGSLALAGGVVFLESSAQTKLTHAQEALAAQKSQFNPDDISEIREFDEKLRAARTVLRNHVSPIKIFTALEEATKQNVQFTAFSLIHEPEEQLMLSLTGTTKQLGSLALQEFQFSEHHVLKNVFLKEAALTSVTEEGEAEEEASLSAEKEVTFTLTGVIDFADALYEGTPSTESSAVSPENEVIPQSENVDIPPENTPATNEAPVL